MKKQYFKIFSWLLCFTMLLGVFSLVAYAETQEYTPVEWVLDPNVEYIYGNEKRYDRYYVNGSFYGDGDSLFYFMNDVKLGDKSCQVYGDSAEPHIVSVRKEGDGYSFVFVDTEGKKILDGLLNRTDCIYYLEDYGYEYSIISEDLALNTSTHLVASGECQLPGN